MRVISIQFNPWIGAVAENAARCEALIKTHVGPDTLFVFPELTLLGYPPRDLLSFPALLRAEQDALKRLQECTRELKTHLLIGHTLPNPGGSRGLFNAASLFSEGQLELQIIKRRLPAYDVFDEERFFDAGPLEQKSTWNKLGFRVRVAICEDDWSSTSAHSKYDLRRYPKLSLAPDPDLHINISASPYVRGKAELRHDLMTALARRDSCSVLYNNAVGGQDDLVFDGQSFWISPQGEEIARGPSCDEAVVIVESNTKPSSTTSSWSCVQLQNSALDSSEELRRVLGLGIRDFVKKSGFSKVALGLSGGIDSALVATLATDALGPDNVLGVSMPSAWTSAESLEEAQDLAARLGIELRQHSIEAAQTAIHSTLGKELNSLTLENIQSRLRGLLLMSIANNERRLILATSNKSELACGYSTLYGDMCGALMPIGDLYKTEVYELAHHICHRDIELGRKERIPLRTRMRAPTAELRPDQKDSDSLPPYEWLDLFLESYLERGGTLKDDAELWDRVLKPTHGVESLGRLIELAEFKRRQAPPVLKIHTRSFGVGWRMPQVKKSYAKVSWT